MAEVVTRRYKVTRETRDCYCRALTPLATVPGVPELGESEVYVLTITDTPLLLDLFESVLAESLKKNGKEV